jgi:hypothetical protein
MRTSFTRGEALAMTRFVLRFTSVLAYAVALTSCGGRNAAAPPVGTASVSIHSWLDSRARPKEILYVSDPFLGVVNLYDPSRKDGRPIGQIADFKQPEGLSVDSSKDLWVADFGHRNVLGFREGSLFPFFELSDPSGYPNAVCSRAYSPMFYVVNFESATGGNGQTIDVYADESKKPTSVLTDPNAANLLYCAVNAKGDLFVTMENTSGCGEVDEFKLGKTTPEVVLTGLAYPTGIAFDDHDYLVVSETNAGAIRIYAPPYGKGPKSSFSYSGSILQIALDASATHLWGADRAHVVAREFSYPDGAAEKETQSEQLFQPAGVALSPAEFH